MGNLKSKLGDFKEGFDCSFGEIPSPKEIVGIAKNLPDVIRETGNGYEIAGGLTGILLDVVAVYVAPSLAVGLIVYDLFK